MTGPEITKTEVTLFDRIENPKAPTGLSYEEGPIYFWPEHSVGDINDVADMIEDMESTKLKPRGDLQPYHQILPLEGWGDEKTFRSCHIVRVLAPQDVHLYKFYPSLKDFRAQLAMLPQLVTVRGRWKNNGDQKLNLLLDSFKLGKHRGPLRFDAELGGWLTTPKGEKATQVLIHLTWRPFRVARAFEMRFLHYHMDEAHLKRGTQELEYWIQSEHEDAILGVLDPSPNYAEVSPRKIVPSVPQLMPDGQGQMTHLVLSLNPQKKIVRPNDMCEPTTYLGEPHSLVHDFDGAWYSAMNWRQVDSDEPGYTSLKTSEGRVFERYLVAFDHDVYPGEGGYPFMGDALGAGHAAAKLENPESIDHDYLYWWLIAKANARCERTGQRSVKRHEDFEANDALYGRIDTGNINLRDKSSIAYHAFQDAIQAGGSLEEFVGPRGSMSTLSSNSQHGVCGAELEAWHRTGVDLYRRQVVRKTEYLKSIEFYNGGVPFSPRASGSILCLTSVAFQLTQRFEPTILGWSPIREHKKQEELLNKLTGHLTSLWRNAGMMRVDWKTVPLPPAGGVDMTKVIHPSLTGRFDTVFCPWMFGWTIQGIVRALQTLRNYGYRYPFLPQLAECLLETLRFIVRYCKDLSEGYAYKLQMAKVWTVEKDGKQEFVEAGTPGATEHRNFVPCDDGGKPTYKYAWNSSKIWLAQGFGAILLYHPQFIEEQDPDLFEEMLDDCEKLIRAHDKDLENRHVVRPHQPSLASAKTVLRMRRGYEG